MLNLETLAFDALAFVLGIIGLMMVFSNLPFEILQPPHIPTKLQLFCWSKEMN
jgi:hypothetical protein